MGYEVELVEVDATPAAVVRGHVDWDRLVDFLGPAFGEVVAVADKQGRRISGAPFARYRESADGQCDIEAGFPLSGRITAREQSNRRHCRAAPSPRQSTWATTEECAPPTARPRTGSPPTATPSPVTPGSATSTVPDCGTPHGSVLPLLRPQRALTAAAQTIRRGRTMTTREPAPHSLTPSAAVDTEARPLPLRVAAPRLARCAARTAFLLARRRLHQPTRNKGRRMTFADGTTGTVYRETVADGDPLADPVVLVVSFRLRGVHGRGHALFRAESLLNTPLFAGFPGFVSKLWLTADEDERYRGFYQWDGARAADDYVSALWWPLAW